MQNAYPENNTANGGRKIWAIESKLANGIILLFLILASLTSIGVVVNHYYQLAQASNIPWYGIKQIYWHIHHDVIVPFGADPQLYLGIPALLCIQALFPAIRSQKPFNTGILVDMVWVFIHGFMVTGFVLITIAALNQVLMPWTSSLKVGVFSNVPAWLEIVLGYLAVELVGWFSHMLRHKVRVLWVFHEVHHSQSQMNPFTLFRVHPMDYLFAEFIIFLPALLFEETLGIVLSYLIISRLHDALTHSNIRTNLGPLRYIFVTPQSHRVHHSSETEYFDMNYGVTLCVWDRLFGTHSPSDFVYPKTGINDPDFPEEKGQKWYKLPWVIIRQMYYPFVKAIRLYWRS